MTGAQDFLLEITRGPDTRWTKVKSAARFRSNKNDSEKFVLVRIKVITFYAPTGEVQEPRVKMAPGGEGWGEPTSPEHFNSHQKAALDLIYINGAPNHLLELKLGTTCISWF